MLDRLAFLEESIAWAVAAILAISGILFLWWGLWEDRSRGRRRCPGCLYDMAGVPGLVCPECGNDARQERRLFKTHYRKRAAVLGLVLLLLAIAAPNVMPMYRHGWRHAIPTWALLTAIRLQGWPGAANAGANPLTAELIRRYKAEELGWGRDAAIKAMMRRWSFASRPKWPAGVPIVVRGGSTRWWDGATTWRSLKARDAKAGDPAMPWVDLSRSRLVLPAQRRGSGRVGVDVRLDTPIGGTNVRASQFRTDWVGRISLPVRIADSIQECIAPARSERIEAMLREHAAVTIEPDANRDRPWVSLEILSVRAAAAAGMAVAVRIELLRDGRVAAETSAPLSGPSFAPWPEHVVRLHFRDSEIDESLGSQDGAERSEWRVRIRSDPALALQDLDATTYWDGEVIIPMLVVVENAGLEAGRRVVLVAAERLGR